MTILNNVFILPKDYTVEHLCKVRQVAGIEPDLVLKTYPLDLREHPNLNSYKHIRFIAGEGVPILSYGSNNQMTSDQDLKDMFRRLSQDYSVIIIVIEDNPAILQVLSEIGQVITI